MKKKNDLAAETITAQALHHIDSSTGAVTPSIHPSSTFGRDDGYDLIVPAQGYTRDENPGYLLPENMLAELEGGKSALLFSSGMAAAGAVVQSLKPGDHIIAPKVMYWGLRNWLITFCDNWGLGLEFFDASDPNALEETARKGQAKLR